MPEERKVSAIVVAGGKGKRMNHGLPKQFLCLKGRPIIVHCLEKFESCHAVHEVILPTPVDHIDAMNDLVRKAGFRKVAAVVAGGLRRQDSVKNGLDAVSEDAGIVLIHDGVRPFVTPDQIERIIDKVLYKRAALLAIPVTNTIKRAAGGVVVETLDRSDLWQAQTPQGFEKMLLHQAYDKAIAENISATDDASLVEHMGHPVHIVEGSPDNIKITTIKDIAIAERILEGQ